VRNGRVEASYTSLIHPPAGRDDFDPYNVMIHGISESDVVGAPELSEILPTIVSFIDGLPLVAHNAAFDMGVLRDSLDSYGLAYPELEYFCTLVLSRRFLNILSFSLPAVAAELGVSLDRHHNADDDARASAEIAISLLQRAGLSTLKELATSVNVRPGIMSAETWAGCQKIQATSERFTPERIAEIRAAIGQGKIDLDNEVTGKTVVFTGTLGSMTRAEAWARVIAAGGNPEAGVTKHTELVIFGVQDAAHLRPGAENSAKYLRAKQLQAKGQAIEVLDEVTFLRMMYDS